MLVGFTGTRFGMQIAQAAATHELLESYLGDPNQFHHGDCIGADAQAHDIADALGYDTVIHPPLNTGLRAYCQGTQVYEPEEYLTRNRRIVASTEVLIAAPDTAAERRQSGTWYTVRQARGRLMEIRIALPDGTVIDG